MPVIKAMNLCKSWQVPAVSECSRQPLDCAIGDYTDRVEVVTTGESSDKEEEADTEALEERPDTVEITTSPSSVSSSAVETPNSADNG